MEESSTYISLDALGGALGVPRSWLKAEADANRIPCLRVNRRRLFNLAAVRGALDERAAAPTVAGEGDDAR